ncbi:TPA: PVL family protein [Staphylococcus aureus]|uniref:SA1788 family PVL leukocidin-associated protein n=1 Tax=Staphylococcus aureus TaxID=1280 RepID=UPI0002477BB4|nr:PVL family protein [Staphylococcus aureus]EHP00612.1 PVL ORF-50-like family protein [Staphylococcus aureus subsp. aureus 21333]CAC6128739.1 putative phi PVL-like protein [Staphylococcus aureus]HCZ6576976.1 PVL family protein [Staphylococcus aureus]HEA4364355.1 PVL family protein [Staphylococcus aureus]HEA6024786.1 PVL family protein [Staphylococcus aureus]
MARRKVIRVRIKGKLMTLREVSEKYHISPELLRYRYKHKMRGDELLCGRKDSISKDEEKGREKIRKKAILNRYQRNVRAEYEQERKRRLRPWLYDGTPQKHSRDPYWFDVTYNQMFKKWSEA